MWFYIATFIGPNVENENVCLVRDITGNKRKVYTLDRSKSLAEQAALCVPLLCRSLIIICPRGIARFHGSSVLDLKRYCRARVCVWERGRREEHAIFLSRGHLQFLFNYKTPACFSQRVAHLRWAKVRASSELESYAPFSPGAGRTVIFFPSPYAYLFSISDVEVLMNWKKEFTKPRD